MRLTAMLAFGLACVAMASSAQAAPDFLAANARAPGVTSLPGLQYKVLKSGPASGATATRGDDVTVRYEGRLADGTLFDATPAGQTTTFPLQKLIPGWIAALQLMRPGDEWMIYLPPNLAYGAKGKGPIPPASTLVFKVELVSTAPHVEGK